MYVDRKTGVSTLIPPGIQLYSFPLPQNLRCGSVIGTEMETVGAGKLLHFFSRIPYITKDRCVDHSCATLTVRTLSTRTVCCSL